MESIKKQGLKDLISIHEQVLPTLSAAVEQLRSSGLEIADNVIKDLADNQCAETKSAADRLAREDSKKIRIPYMRDKAIKEAYAHLQGVIEDSAKVVQRAVRYGTTNPLELDAFAINEHAVVLSDTWIKEKENEYTIAATEKRGRAMALCEAVKQAIDNLNAFATEHKYIHTGIGAEVGGYRNLLYLTEDGKVSNVHLEALESIS